MKRGLGPPITGFDIVYQLLSGLAPLSSELVELVFELIQPFLITNLNYDYWKVNKV